MYQLNRYSQRPIWVGPESSEADTGYAWFELCKELCRMRDLLRETAEEGCIVKDHKRELRAAADLIEVVSESVVISLDGLDEAYEHSGQRPQRTAAIRAADREARQAHAMT